MKIKEGWRCPLCTNMPSDAKYGRIGDKAHPIVQTDMGIKAACRIEWDLSLPLGDLPIIADPNDGGFNVYRACDPDCSACPTDLCGELSDHSCHCPVCCAAQGLVI